MGHDTLIEKKGVELYYFIVLSGRPAVCYGVSDVLGDGKGETDPGVLDGEGGVSFLVQGKHFMLVA